MAKNRPGSSRRDSARCSHCGKKLALRNGRLPAACPTCGAPQKFDRDTLLARPPAREFRTGHLVGVIIGGVLGLLLGIVFGALLKHEAEGGTAILWIFLYAVGFAVLGCAFGFMAVANWTRR